MIDASKLPAVREKQDPAPDAPDAQAQEQVKYARAPAGPGYTPGTRPAATQRNPR